MNAKYASRRSCRCSVTARDNAVLIVDAPALDRRQAKQVGQLLKQVGLDGKKVLWVFDKAGDTMRKSALNLHRVETSRRAPP